MRILAIFAAYSALAVSVSGQSVLIDFDTDADYDGNFVEAAPGNPSATRDAGGCLLKAALADAAATATSAIYDTGATGGGAGSGGTTFSGTRDTFGGTAGSGAFVIQADICYDGTLGSFGTSIGFYTKVPSGEASGYAGLFRLSSATGADFRLYDSDCGPRTARVGAVPKITQTIGDLPPGTFGLGTFYTIRVKVEDVGDSVAFTASILTQAGKLIHEFDTIIDDTSPVLGSGQVGLRISNSTPNNGVRVDNFSVAPVP